MFFRIRKSLVASYGLLFASALAATVFACSPARADQAVVVGVQKYPDLPSEANGLRGCVADAEGVVSALKRKNFTVTLLTDDTAEKPTKENIVGALAKSAKTIRADERFVFYFAGHGSDQPKPLLLTRDCRVNGEAVSGGITSDALYAAVAAIPGRSRSVLLDSCYSGAMSKGERGRFYAPPRRGAKTLNFAQAAVGADVAAPPQGAGQTKVCYFTASLKNEIAMEIAFGNETHGVFTHQLLKYLNDAPPTWAALSASVKNGVYTELGSDRQNPVVSTPFLTTAVFDAPKDSASAASSAFLPLPATVWDLYLTTVADPAHLTLSIQPDISLLAVNRAVPLTAGVGMDGYLLIFDRSQDEHLYLIYPDPVRCSVDEARVSPNLALKIGDLHGDAEGSDRVKAFLFASREYAEKVIGAFRGKAEDGILLGADVKVNVSEKMPGAKRVRLTGGAQSPASPAAPFYTSELSLRFVLPERK